MNDRLSDTLLSELSGFLTTEMGLHFPPDRWRDLERGLRSAAAEFRFPDVETCARRLMSSTLTRAQIEVLASHLTVGETYFFRDEQAFEVFERQALPDLMQRRRGGDRRLRIWSAGCCSGEEPYSIAIALRRALGGAERDVTILGSDINPRFLLKASRGIYRAWSFRNTPDGLREAYFKDLGDGRWELLPEIRRMVRFRHLNLAADVYPSPFDEAGAMDVIFCRNVLIYFSPEQVAGVLHKLHRCLREGGLLVVSPTEAPLVRSSRFEPLNGFGTPFYRKTGASAPAVTVPVPAWQPLSLLPAPSPPAPLPDVVASTPLPVPPDPDVREAPHIASVEATEAPDATPAAPLHEPQEMMRRARAEANQGHLAEALLWCDRLVSNDKLNPAAHYLRATILQERGQAEEATATFQRVLYLDPEFVLAHFALGNLARARKQLRTAHRHFANALALLRRRPPDEILPESDGLTAGRLSEIVTALTAAEKP